MAQTVLTLAEASTEIARAVLWFGLGAICRPLAELW